MIQSQRMFFQNNLRNPFFHLQNKSNGKDIRGSRYSSNNEVGSIRSRARGYWRSLKWFSIPASVGFAYICYLQWGHIKERERRKYGHYKPHDRLLKHWQVEMLKQLPTKSLSRLWGKLSNKEIPIWLREPLLTLYVKMYGCKMEEATVESLDEYSTFRNFFIRKLKPNIRPIDRRHSLVSPVDGTILYYGEVDSSFNLEQVKGVTYTMESFLGPKHPMTKQLIREKDYSKMNSSNAQPHACAAITDDINVTQVVDIQAQVENLKLPKKKKLFHCIIYLAPGDYHWFHAPTEWSIEHRRHIPGELFSVSPFIMNHIQGVFNFNERVLLYGQWKHGPLLMAAVGAYNVGSIKLNFRYEQDLTTNIAINQTSKYYDRLYGAKGIHFSRGDDVGFFELGSTIVLIFHAPEDFKFVVEPGQSVKLGQPIGKDNQSILDKL